ncbi:hypothetical protein ACFVU0_24055, partial [Streptomyces sp. NPDC058122]|uniref:hypothetical protein n=1 Tax=Streptomyces sp. NPDC058122 TaxID=3346349 RepID=UPI0036E0AE31
HRRAGARRWPRCVGGHLPPVAAASVTWARRWPLHVGDLLPQAAAARRWPERAGGRGVSDGSSTTDSIKVPQPLDIS